MINEEILVIEPNKAEKNYWKDLWRYKELFYILAWRDVVVKYKQTYIGVIWALLKPFLTMLIFTILFGGLAKFPNAGNAPYAIVVLAGMLPWTLFSTALADASNSLVTNSNLISKVYFPRLIVPTATIITAFVDFLISFALLIATMLFYKYTPSWKIFFLPIFMILALAASLGPSLWITAVNVKYRDFRYIIPFIVQFGLYVSPVGYLSSIIPAKWQLLYKLNPMVGIIDGFRWCLLNDTVKIQFNDILINLAVITLFLWVGIRKFRKMEKSFADLI